MPRKQTIAAAVALVLMGVAGCSKYTEPYRDAPRGATNTSPADVMTFPDGFSNVAAKCDGPNRVYVAFKADDNRAAIAVAVNDPRCSR